jgi:hypothetical protein
MTGLVILYDDTMQIRKSTHFPSNSRFSEFPSNKGVFGVERTKSSLLFYVLDNNTRMCIHCVYILAHVFVGTQSVR